MAGIKIIATNKKARHDFHILDTFEAGMVLTGSEVKSLRDGQVQLKDSYVSFKSNEAYLQSAHISPYKASSYNNHEPERLRKLLLNRVEIDRIYEALREKGLVCVPLKIYLKKGRIKLELGLAKGKNKGDKRQDIKKKEAQREMDRARKR